MDGACRQASLLTGVAVHMGRARFLFLLLLVIPFPGAAQDTLYVTDKLFLGLYPEADASGKALATLVSGTPLQILERAKYYTRVRTAEGTEGWVKSAYLVEEKPPRLLLEQLQAERDRLAEALSGAREQLQAAQQRATGATDKLRDLESGEAQRTAALSTLETENRSLRARLDQQGFQVPLSWLLAAAALCLLLGLWGGYAWIDYRIRRRHGGFRIY